MNTPFHLIHTTTDRKEKKVYFPIKKIFSLRGELLMKFLRKIGDRTSKNARSNFKLVLARK